MENTINIKNLASEYFKAFSNKQIGVLNNMFSQDVTLKDWELNLFGKEAVLKANKNIFDTVDSIEVKVVNLFVVGEKVIGDNVNDKNTVIGELEITINHIDILLVVDIIEFDDNGKIISIRAYKG